MCAYILPSPTFHYTLVYVVLLVFFDSPNNPYKVYEERLYDHCANFPFIVNIQFICN